MFKSGDFYITTRGRLVKIFNQFPFQDGYVFAAAIYQPNNGWQAARYNTLGICNSDPSNNNININETHDSFGKYMIYRVFYNFGSSSWSATAHDLHNSMIVELHGIENRERIMHLIQVGAGQKLLSWMREAGYDDELQGSISA